MNNTTSIDSARSEDNFWLTVLRRTGNKLLDPVFVRDLLEEQERKRALLNAVDLGDRAHFLLLSFGVHRVWCICTTVRHSPHTDGLPRNQTYAIFEWESERTLKGIVTAPMHSKRDGQPCINRQTIFARHLLDAGTHPVEPKDIRRALERHFLRVTETIDLDDLDAIGMLRVLDYLMRHNVALDDALSMRRAYKHATEMRELVRRCFSRSLELWDGDPIRELGS